MGNTRSTEFTNLEEISKEKSIHSFNIKLIETSFNNQKNIKEITVKKKGIDYKLKLYPSTLTLKNDNIKLDFSYYEIFSWTTSKNFFCFHTKKDSYYCKTINYKIALDIAKSLKDICTNLLQKNKANSS